MNAHSIKKSEEGGVSSFIPILGYSYQHNQNKCIFPVQWLNFTCTVSYLFYVHEHIHDIFLFELLLWIVHA